MRQGFVVEHEFERAAQFGFRVMGLLVGKMEGDLVGLELLGLWEGEKVDEDIPPIGASELVGLYVGYGERTPCVGDTDGDGVPPTEHPAVRLTSCTTLSDHNPLLS